MQRYFAKDKTSKEIILHDSDIYHIKKVMRMNIDDEIEVVYDKKIYLCNIDSLDEFSLSIVSSYENDSELPISLTVALSLVTEQKFDLILQKLTELGVTKIIPLKTERSIVRIDKERENKKIVRWNNICKEASEQSHRVIVPIVTDIMNVTELKDIDADIKLVCSLIDDSKSINNYINKNNNSSVMVVIGPEGGISNNETNLLNSYGFKNITLGKRVLRVETAAIYIASIISYIYEG